MAAIPYNTPTVTVFNTRMPVEWYQHFLAKATARNMTVGGYVQATIRERCSAVDEQRMALADAISITAVRQRMLREAHPDLPEWDSGVSRIRANTPLNALEKHKSSSEDNRDKPRVFSLQIPMSQAMYYGIKRMAAEKQMEPEQFARKILSAGYKGVATVFSNVEVDNVDAE